ncbi:MAG TPA: KEOPS complex kinase/ATPase Bud32 [Nitrososphaerales archaeon]
MEKLIRKGAEASIYLSEWFEFSAIRKERLPKHYRQKALDDAIRTQRTLREALLIAKSREAGVPTPLIYFVDPKKAEIIMQNLEGKRLKEIFLEDGMTLKKNLAREAGRMVAKLHSAGIVHGDLTTSNFIFYDDKLYLIDFGLASQSTKFEDMGVDLKLIKEVLNSAHYTEFQKLYPQIVAGYEEVAGKERMKKVLAVVSEIEKRGRYARVE